MSIGWICHYDYVDGIHRVKHKETGIETFVELDIASVFSDEMYYVVDCRTGDTVSVDDYEHIAHYVNGSYNECREHKGVWLFDDGEDVYDECPKCKSAEDEILSFKVADDVYQYKNNREFNRLKGLLKAEKYQHWNSDNIDDKPQQGLFILITEYDAEWGETYYYYKTVEKSFIDELEWGEK